MWVWRLKLVRPKIEDRRRKKQMRQVEHWVRCSGRKSPAVEEIESVFEENRQTRSAHSYCRARIIRNYTMENNWVVRYSRFQSKPGMSHIFISAANYRRSSQLQFFFQSSTDSFFLSFFESATNHQWWSEILEPRKDHDWKSSGSVTTRAKETIRRLASGMRRDGCTWPEDIYRGSRRAPCGIAMISIQLSLISVLTAEDCELHKEIEKKIQVYLTRSRTGYVILVSKIFEAAGMFALRKQ